LVTVFGHSVSLVRSADATELSALVRFSVTRATTHDGFEPGRPHGVVYAPVDSPAFMVRRLSAYDPSWRGPFRFGWEPSP
jgi:hypothetical protein